MSHCYDDPILNLDAVNKRERSMGRYMPRSQTRAVMAEKERIAAQLLRKGLTTTQVAAQLRCSPFFVRKVRSSLLSEGTEPGM